MLDRNGQRREGLRVEVGTHPRPGTRYSVTMVAQRPPEPTPAEREELTKLLRARHDGTDQALQEWGQRRRDMAAAAGRLQTVLTTSTVEIVADDSHRVVVRTTHDHGRVVIETDLERPTRPERLTIDRTSNVVVGGWLAKGKLKVEASCKLDSLPAAHDRAPQFTGSLRHRQLRGRASIAITETGTGRWDVDNRAPHGRCQSTVERRSGSAVASMATMRPATTVNAMIEMIVSSTVITTPGSPLTLVW